MKTDNLIPAAPLDRRELAPGVQLCFTRLDAPLCPPPLDWPRLLVFDFCRSGRRAIPDGAQYAIVTEGHAAVSFAVPGADFYLPGSQYEALQLFIDPDAVQADSFLTLMGLEIGGIADYFCRGGVHCCPMSDAITAIVDEVWDDAAYAAPGELRYAAVRLLYELLRLPDEADTARCPARQVECVREAETLVLQDLSIRRPARELADHFGLSESGFKLYCQNVLGEGYLAYFRRRRLEEPPSCCARPPAGAGHRRPGRLREPGPLCPGVLRPVPPDPAGIPALVEVAPLAAFLAGGGKKAMTRKERKIEQHHALDFPCHS